MASFSNNNTFPFGAGANTSFEFAAKAAPGNPFTATTPAAPERSAGLPPPGDQYVTLAQYETIESRYEDVLKRLEILEAEAKGHEATKKMLKIGSQNLERAYQGLQATHQTAETRLKSLQCDLQDLNKKFEICKAALQISQDQHKATANDLKAALKREEDAASTPAPVSAPPSATPAPVLGFAPIVSEHLAPVAISPPPRPALSMVPVLSVSVEPVSPPPPPPSPVLALAPIMAVDLAPVSPPSPPTIISIPDTVWLAQTVVNWHLCVLWLLISGWTAAWLVSGLPAGGEPLGFGGAAVLGDGFVARVHAGVFGLLVDLSGGLEVFV
jgi:hypothetical protein